MGIAKELRGSAVNTRQVNEKYANSASGLRTAIANRDGTIDAQRAEIERLNGIISSLSATLDATITEKDSRISALTSLVETYKSYAKEFREKMLIAQHSHRKASALIRCMPKDIVDSVRSLDIQ